MLDFWKHNWVPIISTIVLILGLLYSIVSATIALRVSNDANDLAKEAIDKTKQHFFETYRPILLVGPVHFQDGKAFSLLKVNEKILKMTILISISNKGNVIASRTNIYEAGVMIAANGKPISNIRNFYDHRGNQVKSKEQAVKSNFTHMDVPPGATFIKELTFELSLDDTDYNFDMISKLQKTDDLIVNVSLMATYGYEQIEGKEFATHTTHAITTNGIMTLDNRFTGS